MRPKAISYEIFESLFPFSFVTTLEGKIIAMAPSLCKMVGEGKIGAEFGTVFRFLRPEGTQFTPDLAQRLKSEMITVEDHFKGSRLMGQIIQLPKEGALVFVVNLLISDGHELAKLELDFNDFAVQDQIFDFLMLSQTQRKMMSETDTLNRKLAEAHRVAVKASEMKSQFLANMSHELRTPMNGVVGMASVLAETSLDAEQKEFVDCIITSGDGMIALINDILDLSKIESGHIALESVPVDLRSIVGEIDKTLTVLAEKKKLNLSFEIDPKVPQQLIGDPIRLRQIVLNLVGNAIKFTHKGSIKTTVTLESQSPDGASILRISVRDTGIGMNLEEMDRVFSPFVQADNSMTRKFGGTGLGLSICKKLVEAMDGQISVTSELGVGSEFSFSVALGQMNAK